MTFIELSVITWTYYHVLIQPSKTLRLMQDDYIMYIVLLLITFLITYHTFFNCVLVFQAMTLNRQVKNKKKLKKQLLPVQPGTSRFHCSSHSHKQMIILLTLKYKLCHEVSRVEKYKEFPYCYFSVLLFQSNVFFVVVFMKGCSTKCSS